MQVGTRVKKNLLVSIIFILLLGCSTIPKQNKYDVGDCVIIYDHEVGHVVDPNVIVKVEEISETHYTYRWWLPRARVWGKDLFAHPLGEFKIFHKMTVKTPCPE